VNQRKEHGRLFRDAGSLCHHLSMWLKGLSKQREGNMNTITINTETDGQVATITYTETEVLHFRKRAQEIDAIQQVNDLQRKEIRDIRNEVRDFFSEGEWSDGETTVNKGDTNAMLERIGCNKLTTKYRGTFMVNGTFEIEVEDEDEIESIITDNLSVDCYDADIDVDSIEVHDVEENN
jgi:hypothetical protein